MASLETVFVLSDKYLVTVDKMNKKTEEAVDKILDASGSTGKFNESLKETETSAGKASTGLGKYLKISDLIDGAIKGMSIADEFINTSNRLDLINDGLQTQAELQDKVFAAVNRSRDAYGDMANAVSNMGLMAGDAFASNDELIEFTELAQKSFKIGGGDASEQQGAMGQLTQAMANGGLQGDEFASITEKAPLIGAAIETYMQDVMGMTGTIEEWSSQGLISAEVIKNAMFMAGNDIDEKFSSMPMTFADIWNRIKNGALEAFRPIIEASKELINSETFHTIINGIIIGVNLLTGIIGEMINVIAENWAIVQPILMAIGMYLAYIGGVALIGILQSLYAVIVAEWATIAPILMIIATIAATIHMFQTMGVTVEDIFGFIGGVIGAAIAGIWNLLLGLFELVLGILNFWVNKLVIFTNFFANVFKNPISSVIYLFQGLADNVLGVIEKIASAMDFVFGSKMADTVANWRSGLKEMADAAVSKYAPEENYKKVMDTIDLSVSDFGFERMNYKDSYEKGNKIGKDVYGGLSDVISGLKGSLIQEDKEGSGWSNVGAVGTSSDPLTVKGTGNNNSVEVDMADEDLKYLRDIAEREYINKFSTATLAPNVKVTFGDVHENADADKLAGKIQKILQEEIAITAEGAY